MTISKSMNCFISVAFLLCTQVARSEPSLNGVFVGHLTLDDGKVREVPFQLSMTLSDETEIVETVNGPEQRRVIDASFAVDGEGGPYTFSKITYDIDLNVIDMRYSRIIGGDDRSPASLRLTGKFNDDGSLQGRIVSGYYGVMGTFTLAKTAQRTIEHRNVYSGMWAGHSEWSGQDFVVQLQPTLTNTLNPPGMELGFTPGKVGGIDIGGGAQIGFNSVSIDYLRQRLVLASVDPSGPNISLNCDIVPVSLDLDCQFDSVYGGRKGPVYLKKIR
jgi:hypothetical protein